MKSGIKHVDSTGRSGPILSQLAQKRLDDYKALAPDENSKELDGKALYTMGRGMAHGRVPIGDGAIEKAAVLVHATLKTIKPTNPDHYQSVLKENDQLKETNEMLVEENSVNRELVMRLYADFEKEPPVDLLQRLQNIDARRHQTTGSPYGDDDMDNGIFEDDVDDNSWHESDDDESITDGEDLEDDGDDLQDDGGDNGSIEGDDDYSNDLDADLGGDHSGSKGVVVAADRSDKRS